MRISTGETTEWLRPEDAQEIRDLLAERGYSLDTDEVFVLAVSDDEFEAFHDIYMDGVRDQPIPA